jgi:hypothetical protein
MTCNVPDRHCGQERFSADCCCWPNRAPGSIVAEPRGSAQVQCPAAVPVGEQPNVPKLDETSRQYVE